jgi:hypothetical protein
VNRKSLTPGVPSIKSQEKMVKSGEKSNGVTKRLARLRTTAATRGLSFPTLGV